MSHIVEFTINGLAGRKKPFHRKLDRKLNVFFGLNGSGKTSLLKILQSAMNGDARTLDNVPFDSAIVNIYSINYQCVFIRTLKRSRSNRKMDDIQAPAEIEAELQMEEYVQLNRTDKKHSNWTQTPDIPDNDVKTASWRHRYLPTSRLHIVQDVRYPSRFGLTESQEYLTEEQLDTVFAQSLESLWSQYSSDMLIDVRLAQEKGLARIIETFFSPSHLSKSSNEGIPDAKSAYICLKNFLQRQTTKGQLGPFKSFQKRYDREESLQQVAADIHQIEQQIEKAMEPRNKLQRLIERLYSGDKHVSFGDKSIVVKGTDNKRISLSSLSSGEKHLMRILVETILAEESTILIDEPELSMHIDWQRELLGILTNLNPNAQFIIATHSPEIMADIPDERIISL